jgi:hypothetical protein
MKSASVYRRAGVYFVHPLAGCRGGMPCLFSEPVFKLDPSAGATVLGETVMAALQACRHDAPWPREWKGFVKPLHDAAGVRSEAAFYKGLLHVRVDVSGMMLNITPTSSKGSLRGSSPIMEKIISTELADAASLGALVLKSLADSN